MKNTFKKCLLTGFVLLVAYPLYAGPDNKDDKDTPCLDSQEEKDLKELRRAEGEQRKADLENDMIRAKLTKELAMIRAEIERLRFEKEAILLRWEIEQAKAKQDNQKEILALSLQRDKIESEVALTQAKLKQIMEEFNLSSVSLQNKTFLLEVEAKNIHMAMEKIKVERARSEYVGGPVEYLENPLKGDVLTLSDRQVALNGLITPWKANYVVDRIQYFNNQNTKYPIFIVIGESPGGSGNAGWRILQAMERSQAPIYVVVKGYACSMAAVICALADRSYICPNARLMHHQPNYFMSGYLSVREIKEAAEYAEKRWKRFYTPIAKKMGITLKEWEKRLYEKSQNGCWIEFGDDAKKLKWVDHVISGIHDNGVREIPKGDQYTAKKYFEEYFSLGFNNECADLEKLKCALTGPNDFYYVYDPENKLGLRKSSNK